MKNSRKKLNKNPKQKKNKKTQKILGGAAMTRNENHEKSRPRTLDIPFGIVTHQTIGDCIKELIEIFFSFISSIKTCNIKKTLSLKD